MGCTLAFVGFGQYQVQLGFHGNQKCFISIEGDYVVTPAGRESATFSEAVGGALALLPLLGHSAALASVAADGTVRVSFDDGTNVELLDSSTQYEGYQVNLGDQLLIV